MGTTMSNLSDILKNIYGFHKPWHHKFKEVIEKNNKATIELYKILYKPTEEELQHFGLK